MNQLNSQQTEFQNWLTIMELVRFLEKKFNWKKGANNQVKRLDDEA